MKSLVIRGAYVVAVAFLAPTLRKWWRRYLAQKISGLKDITARPKRYHQRKAALAKSL